MASVMRSYVSIIYRTRLSFRPHSTVARRNPSYYQAAHYYPVRIGDVFHASYQVAGKLGYVAYSTSWLCRDLHAKNYTVLKVSTSLPDHLNATDRELKVYEHMTSIDSSHPGRSFIRELYDSFDLQGPGSTHRCLVMQPMHMTLLEMVGMNPRPFDLPLLKMTVKRLLLTLDFLHAEAGVIHTGRNLRATDILMLSLEDSSMLANFATAESERPSPRNRRLRRPAKYGLTVLCNFGEARVGRTHESGPFVQPHIYRAPQVIFEMPWGSAIDIWNLAGLIWDLFEGQHLFGDIFASKGGHDPFKHLALMVALIGPPPSDFVRRSETMEQCFDTSGSWIAHEEAPVTPVSLERLEQRLVGEDKELLLAFIRSMLKWMPEERKTARQLLDHPFLS
ncbi:hypothetical protein BDW74DRAFT_164678 [Aspergillus multicolor]|uniref:putative protein kinase n=1 Tax=Aspergillus multicolor TaxID=41759 RepID=UPI003CCCF7F7